MDRKFKVFVSYRHSDSHAAARIVHFLTVVFGADAIFHDIRSIPAGVDFRQALVDAISNSEIVLAIIGPTWIESFSQKQLARKGDEADWVVVELSEAFDRNIRVIPVTIFPAGLPARELLPVEIQGLAFLQARVIWPDLAFENSVHQLIDELQVIIDGDRPKGIDTSPSSSRDHTSGRLASSNSREVRRARLKNPPTLALRLLMVATVLLLCIAILAGITLFHRPAKPKLELTEKQESGKVAKPQFIEPTTAQRMQFDRIVSAFRRSTPSPVRERSPHSTEQGTLGLPDFSAFTVLSDEIVWDIRGFSLRKADDPPFTSYAIMNRRIRFQKLVECSEIRFEARTSATDVFLHSISHPDQSQEFVSQSPRIVGKVPMRVRQLAIDISTIPLGKDVTIEYEATYWDSLQTPEDTWIGAIGYGGTDMIRMIVIFPETKPYISYNLMTARTRNDPPEEFRGESVFYTDASKLFAYWEISFVEGVVYQFHWKW